MDNIQNCDSYIVMVSNISCFFFTTTATFIFVKKIFTPYISFRNLDRPSRSVSAIALILSIITIIATFPTVTYPVAVGQLRSLNVPDDYTTEALLHDCIE
jgi:hypothetical protein